MLGRIMEGAKRATRKTRIVCISDTHNAFPGGGFQLPKGDVLIHAGDLTNQGTFSELEKTVKWIEEADFEEKIIVAGNHDLTLDTDFYKQHGNWMHNQRHEDPAKCQALIDDSPTIRWLKHEAVTIKLSSPNGPRTQFKIFGSPLSPEFGIWAFGYRRDNGAKIWSQIPLDTDIVITHGPPLNHCDETVREAKAGCEALREALWRIRPRLAICGHIHEGRGVDRVRWDLGKSNIKFKEARVEHWTDPGLDNKKMSLLDLTTKGRTPLDNDGSMGDWQDCERTNISSGPIIETEEVTSREPSGTSGISQITSNLDAAPSESLPLTTRGQGGEPPSETCDLEALSGRMGRRETCIINASISARSWPPQPGGKQFHKPIVVDIDLPLWEDD